MAALLDINVLLALAWPCHLHHQAAHQWFAARRQGGWATCMHTQLGFIRLSMQPGVVAWPVSFVDATTVLANSTSVPAHQFWPQNFGFSQIRQEIQARLIGHQQLADAALLELAIRSSGTLATFDRRIARLLPDDSPLQRTIELIPA